MHAEHFEILKDEARESRTSFFSFPSLLYEKKIGLLSITEWSQARRLSVCINNKSQRRRSLLQKEVAAHSSSAEDGSNADRISLHAVGQSQLSFLSLPPIPQKALGPWNRVTKGLGWDFAYLNWDISSTTAMSSEFICSLGGRDVFLLVIGVVMHSEAYEPQ